MKSRMTSEQIIAGMATLMIAGIVVMGLFAAYHEEDIDLRKSHMVVFEASRQLSDFDRLRYVTNQVILEDPTMRENALDRAFAMTTSRMRNFRNGEMYSVEDSQVQQYIGTLIAMHDRMTTVMAMPECDDMCRAKKLNVSILQAKRVLTKLQGRALAHDGQMRGTLQALHETTVRKLFTVAFLLVGIFIAVAMYMARKNAILRQQTACLEQSQRRIAEVSEYRARFLAGMSHEFRTPLNAIKGFSQLMLLMRDQVSEEKVNEYLTSIEKSAVDLEKLTDTVLDLAKIDAGAMELDELDFDLSEIMRDVAAQFRVGNALGAHRLMLDIPPSLIIRGDSAALKRCAQNLISNALKFSDETTGVHVKLSNEANGITLRVQDSGCGIPAEEMHSVWGVYARSTYTRVSDKQGTGLGLPIVRALVEAHGGTATLDSRIDEGTTVTVVLPGFRALSAKPLSIAA